jgi:integrase
VPIRLRTRGCLRISVLKVEPHLVTDGLMAAEARGVRVIPLPTVVVDSLAAHLLSFPAKGLTITNAVGDPIKRSDFGYVWLRVTKSVDLEGLHFHDLHHFYASLLIRHGESVKTVQARLGHANAAATLDTYSHLWPDSDDRTREAVDLVLRISVADSLRTEASSS